MCRVLPHGIVYRILPSYASIAKKAKRIIKNYLTIEKNSGIILLLVAQVLAHRAI